MAYFLLYYVWQLAKRSIKAVRNEDWIVAKTAISTRFGRDLSLTNATGTENNIALFV